MLSKLYIFFCRFNNKKKIGDSDTRHSEIIESLQLFLGFEINQPQFYLKSLTHRSYVELNAGIEKSNERLEFLGDSVLGMVVAKYLFKKYESEEEGFLTKVRSHLVNREALAFAAEKMQLDRFLLYDKRFIRDSKEGFKTIIADALEALVGAIYLDQGLKRTEKFILNWIVNPNIDNGSITTDTNYKGQLLEYTHAYKLSIPTYMLSKTQGPEHAKKFTVEVYVDGQLLGTGVGKSKKTAEQEASKNALYALTHLDENQ